MVLLCDYILKKGPGPVEGEGGGGGGGEAMGSSSGWVGPLWGGADSTSFLVPEDWVALRKKYAQKNFHFIDEMFHFNSGK